MYVLLFVLEILLYSNILKTASVS